MILGACLLLSFGVKIGLAGSDSLAQTGSRVRSLSAAEEGRRLDRQADPDGGLITSEQGAPGAAAELARVDGVLHTVVSTDPGNVRQRSDRGGRRSDERDGQLGDCGHGPQGQVRGSKADPESSAWPARGPIRSTSCKPSTATSR